MNKYITGGIIVLLLIAGFTSGKYIESKKKDSYITQGYNQALDDLDTVKVETVRIVKDTIEINKPKPTSQKEYVKEYVYVMDTVYYPEIRTVFRESKMDSLPLNSYSGEEIINKDGVKGKVHWEATAIYLSQFRILPEFEIIETTNFIPYEKKNPSKLDIRIGPSAYYNSHIDRWSPGVLGTINSRRVSYSFGVGVTDLNSSTIGSSLIYQAAIQVKL